MCIERIEFKCSLNDDDYVAFKIPDDVDIDSEQLNAYTGKNKVFYVLCKLLKLEEIKKNNSADGNDKS